MGLHDRLSDTICTSLTDPAHRNTILAHWGAFESGKSRAVRNSAVRMQTQGCVVISVNGYDFFGSRSGQRSMRAWLQTCIGIPSDRSGERMSLLLPERTVFMIDGVEGLLKHFETGEVLGTLRELDSPVLLLFSSWERALEMVVAGCRQLAHPSIGRWTEEELTMLYDSLSADVRANIQHKKVELLRCAVLSGSPGVLFFEAAQMSVVPSSIPDMKRARLIDAEWRNGILALSGEAVVDGVVGRFPDKNGVFHWEE